LVSVIGYLKLAAVFGLAAFGTAVETCLTLMLEDEEIGGSASARTGLSRVVFVMRDRSVSISSLMAGVGAAVLLVASVFLAGESRADMQSSARDAAGLNAQPAASGELPPIKSRAEPGDELAVLRAIDAALSEVGDGSTYVWDHGNGRLAGAIRVTSTFRDRDARICRHLVVTMRLGSYTRRSETIACRGGDGIWSLDG